MARNGKTALFENFPKAGRTNTTFKIRSCTISRTISANIAVRASTRSGFAPVALSSLQALFFQCVQGFQNAVALVERFRNSGAFFVVPAPAGESFKISGICPHLNPGIVPPYPGTHPINGNRNKSAVRGGGYPVNMGKFPGGLFFKSCQSSFCGVFNRFFSGDFPGLILFSSPGGAVLF